MSEPRYHRWTTEVVVFQSENCDAPHGFVLHLGDGFHVFRFDGDAYRDIGAWDHHQDAQKALIEAEAERFLP